MAIVPDVVVAPPPQRPKSMQWIAAAILLIAAGGLFLAVRQRPVSVSAGAIPETAPLSNVSATSPVPSLPSGDEKRILCGRPPGLYVDRYGQTWDGDRYSKGGEAVQVQTAVISAGFDRNVFRGMRVGHQSYQIPLKQGIYQMELLFAETEYGDGNPLEGGELSRPFRVLVNGDPVLPELDIIAETVQPNLATSRIVTGLSPAADGLLHIELQAISTGEPFVNAIIIRPATGKQALPVRIICRTHRYRDSKGRIWEPDHYFRGGSSIIRPTTPGVPDGEIFRGERYGKFTYAIPVVAGAKYQASLYMWESWLGPGRPGEGGVGTRVFSVFCNTVPLFRHYDLIADTGPDQVKIKTFRDLEPDRNGMLVFSFDAEANKALLNAIEVIDQSL
ncbi:MAG TPA: malectin domain-containing carbohydrate-binding protein [Bryobacteraceae bacterium]